MKMILQYLRTHRRSVVLFSVCAVILTALYILFDVEERLIAYGYVVCIAVGLALSVGDFFRYWDKHERLQLLEAEAIDTLDHLPQAQDLMEEDYQRIISALFANKQQLAYQMQHRFEDMEGYYTTWVHQIKTPIAAMRLILQTEFAGSSAGAGVMPDVPDDAAETRARAAAETEALRRELTEELFKIEQYVEMVLCYLKLEEQGTDYVLRRCDLDEILRQAVHKYAGPFIRSKNRLIFEETHAQVLTDEKWLSFVIEQLLSNAIKYTRGGEIRIAMQEPGVLTIADSGIGIAPEDLPRIFEKGFTGYNGRSDKKSSGIGLYLCRRIAENLGCEISAASAVGIGTTVSLRFGSEACKNVRYE